MLDQPDNGETVDGRVPAPDLLLSPAADVGVARAHRGATVVVAGQPPPGLARDFLERERTAAVSTLDLRLIYLFRNALEPFSESSRLWLWTYSAGLKSGP